MPRKTSPSRFNQNQTTFITGDLVRMDPDIKQSLCRHQFPLISRLGCRTSARLDWCVIKGLVLTLRLSRESRAGERQTRKRAGDQWSTGRRRFNTTHSDRVIKLSCASLCGLQAGGEISAPAWTSVRLKLPKCLHFWLWKTHTQRSVLLYLGGLSLT